MVTHAWVTHAVSNKALKGLDARVRDGTNIVKGLQSTVQKLQNELERSNTEVAKAHRAQAATERAVRSIEVRCPPFPCFAMLGWAVSLIGFDSIF